MRRGHKGAFSITCTIILLAVCILSGCTSSQNPASVTTSNGRTESINTRELLNIVIDVPDTTDPQCTSEYYTVALNVFDRLVEIRINSDGSSLITPSLADSWKVSDDGLTYTFQLHEGVKFSNGMPLTASDVEYTLTRLLSNPESSNQDIAMSIRGAQDLVDGKTDKLEGVRVIDDTHFEITLSHPYAAFLACLSTPGASILDEETTTVAGRSFGRDPLYTIGTGPFVFHQWIKGDGMILLANEDYWSGAPKCKGIYAQFISDSEAQRMQFEHGTLDILDLENLGTEAEYFIHGDIYQHQLAQGPRVGISYIALNETVEPLQSASVRKALQIGLDRQTLLNAIYSGRGALEHGIFPHGLIGYDPDIPEIPYDPEKAKTLLAEAGYPDGFDLTISLSAASVESTKDLVSLIAYMWQKIGVNATIETLDDDTYMEKRTSGELACYTSTWSADFNDPDNFIYTFFGTKANTNARSLCYQNDDVIRRVQAARAITDEEQRIQEYQNLENLIVQKDAAWIPLFSRQHYFIISDRVEGFQVAWNGWSSTRYQNISLADAEN